ncbi:nucleotidyltransferase family protein [Lachnospiraceae bacterium OttesenSCG-928-J05]|nr:nucleotidyltransferase family protein [Lachnospiraceae bacterium OttesenSCG-928-J05]
MREDSIRTYEADCLIKLIEAILSKQELPKFEQDPDWEKLYKLAIYHNVGSIAYCCLLGTEAYELDPWKEKLAKIYHKAVSLEGHYTAQVPRILEALEKARIDCVLFGDYILRVYYPRPEMRPLSSVNFLVDQRDCKAVRAIMMDLDFSEEQPLSFKKEPGLCITFYPRLEFLNKQFSKYFNIPLKQYVTLSTHRYVRGFEPEEFYLYLLACVAEAYAKGDMDMGLLLDYRCFYRALYKTLDWGYLSKESERLKMGVFPEYITKLSALWYDGFVDDWEDAILTEMEAYVLTKGESGRVQSEKLLPLVRQVVDIYQRKLQKKRRRERLEILFPNLEYMQAMYRILRYVPPLLPFCWLLRGVRLRKDKIIAKKVNKK